MGAGAEDTTRQRRGQRAGMGYDKRGGAGLASPRWRRFTGGNEGTARGGEGREQGIGARGGYERRMRASPWKAQISRAITLRLWKIA